jgi:hypothetical protein
MDSFSFSGNIGGSANSKTIKDNLSSWSNRKYEGSTITQNFFNANFDN